MGTMSNEQNSDALKKATIIIRHLQNKIAGLERKQNVPVAVTGMACRFPGESNSPARFWENLKRGFDARGEIPAGRFDISRFYHPENQPGTILSRYGAFIRGHDLFDAEYFGISSREAARMDPQQRILLEVTVEALEDAAIGMNALSGSQTGVFIGCMGHDFYELSSECEPADIHTGTGTSLSVLSGRISYLLNLRGPSMTIDTACSSSLVTVCNAVQSLRSLQCDCAIAGGVNLILSPTIYLIESRNQMLAPDGHCKPFDDHANGFLRGEGCGVLVLKRLDDALRDGDRILAVIRGCAVNHNGKSGALMVPSGIAQEAVIRQALRDADTDPSRIGFIEAHGTGTALGDPIEVNALEAVYGKSGTGALLIGSVKSNMGHLEGAAGIAGLMKAILAVRHRELPPSIHVEKLNRHIDWENIRVRVNTFLSPLGQDRMAAVSSFGFSGTNAHLILSPYENNNRPANRQLPVPVLLISAKSEQALQNYLIRYENYLAQTKEPWADICYTAAIGRSHHPFRIAFLAGSTEEALLLISDYRRGVRNEKIYCRQYTRQKGSGDMHDRIGDWVKGADVDWQQIFGAKAAVKTEIPGYPWEHRRYWLKQTVEKSLLPAGHIYIRSRKAVNPQPGNLQKLFVIFTEGATCLPALKEPSFPLAATIDEAQRVVIVHRTTPQEKERDFLPAEALLPVCQKMIGENRVKKTDVILVAGDPDENHFPLLYAMNGMLGSLRTERPEYAGGVAMVPNDMAPEKLNDVLQYLQQNSDSCLLSDHRQCFQIGLQQMTGKVSADAFRLPQGVIVIIGGNGFIGSHFMDALIAQGAREFLITSRNLEKPASGRDGTRITPFRMDPASNRDWERLKDAIGGKRPGMLIHAAGHYAHRLTEQMQPADIWELSREKTEGGNHLLKWCLELRPGQVILNSSAVSVTGAPYLGHYAFANGYLDGIGHALNAEGIPATVINWGGWQGSRMLADASVTRFQEQYGFYALPAEQLVTTALGLAGSGIGQAAVMHIDWAKFRSATQFNRLSWYFDEKPEDRPGLKKEATRSRHEVLEIVTRLSREKLQMPPGREPDINLAFEEMGFDSLMSVELIQDLRKEFGLDLSVTLLFEYSNINQVASHLYEQMQPSSNDNESWSLDEIEAKLNKKLNKDGI